MKALWSICFESSGLNVIITSVTGPSNGTAFH